MMLRTHFQFPDGDHYPIHLSETASGGLRLSDRGHTLMHISYEHNIDVFMDRTRRMLIERIMNESGLQWDKGVAPSVSIRPLNSCRKRYFDSDKR